MFDVYKRSIASFIMFFVVAIRAEYLQIVSGIVFTIAVFVVYVQDWGKTIATHLTNLTKFSFILTPPAIRDTNKIIAKPDEVGISNTAVKAPMVRVRHHFSNSFCFVALAPKRIIVTGLNVTGHRAVPDRVAILLNLSEPRWVNIKLSLASFAFKIHPFAFSLGFAKLKIVISHISHINISKGVAQ